VVRRFSQAHRSETDDRPRAPGALTWPISERSVGKPVAVLFLAAGSSSRRAGVVSPDGPSFPRGLREAEVRNWADGAGDRLGLLSSCSASAHRIPDSLPSSRSGRTGRRDLGNGARGRRAPRGLLRSRNSQLLHGHVFRHGAGVFLPGVVGDCSGPFPRSGGRPLREGSSFWPPSSVLHDRWVTRSSIAAPAPSARNNR